ncbi:MAG: C4-dicarboxylate ABC transporter substrate-binding protein [Actinophytocola sp.]|nr:C4-dicarboxylate ABC transporter substrate-binding protein [Actinophytocola sp.]
MVQKKRLLSTLCALTLAIPLSACGLADSGGGGGDGDQVTLRLSHQWPAPDNEGEGDFRSVLAQRFADEVRERTDGQVNITIHPNNSLIEDATQQYDAMTKGATDLSVFPLDYASGDVPEFSITLMPTMIRNHEEARKWQDSEVGRRIEEITEANGVKLLTWVWNAGAIGTKGAKPLVSPDDVKKGEVTRAAGSRVEQMLEQAGLGISSMSSSEIYNGMQTGVLDSAITSTGSFSSYRLHEQVKSFTSPSGGNTFWFMFEPLIISKDKFDKLTPEQQKVMEEVGQELQDFAYEASEQDDARVDKEFRDAGVNVVNMDDEAFSKWREAAEPVWEDFAKDVEGGDELIRLGQQASEG